MLWSRQVCVALALTAMAQAGFVRQPYLQDPRGSSIVVRWETAARLDGVVEYGLSAGYGLQVTQPDSTTEHELVLTGLLQDTVYHYRCISGGDTSADRVFRSRASPPARLRFVVLGDPHGDSSVNQRVADRLAQTVPGPALVASTGDLTGDGRSVSYRRFFNTQQAWLGRAPLLAAPGNHDYDSIANWFRFFTFPANERWYSFRDGNCAFHCLDAYDSVLPGSSQYQWLATELRADSADPDVRHVFVFIHTPAYSTNAVYSGNADVRQYLCPLFERYGVDIVFSGHVHAYEHSLVNGVHYLTTGGGGATLATSWNSAQPWTVYREACYEFVLVDVRGDTVVTCGVRVNGTEFDSLVLVRNLVGATEPIRVDRFRTRLSTPSPVTRVARLELQPGHAGEVRVSVVDASGREVAVPLLGRYGSGGLCATWHRASSPAGVYHWLVRVGPTQLSVAFVLLD